MLYVKIMSDEDLDDTQPYKNYTIVPIANNEVMRFIANPESGTDREYARYVLEVHAPEGGIETHELTGNAYVMTESGKTMASHGA
jgi:hypothetical protein